MKNSRTTTKELDTLLHTIGFIMLIIFVSWILCPASAFILYLDHCKGWKLKGSKYLWIKKQIEPFCIHTSNLLFLQQTCDGFNTGVPMLPHLLLHFLIIDHIIMYTYKYHVYVQVSCICTSIMYTYKYHVYVQVSSVIHYNIR